MAALLSKASQPLGPSRQREIRMLPRRGRRAHHKVKTGCEACKSRRQKCDERRPVCFGCTRHSTKCRYPSSQRSSQSELRILTTATDSLVAATTSPHSSLTRGLPISPSVEMNLGDLELLHQYLTSTCIASTQQPEMTAHIQTVIPPLAQKWPFVMRGILAMAATHLSRLRPAQQAHYATAAAKHHSIATPEFRTALQDINEDNCLALVSYSKHLVWCSFATNELSNTAKQASLHPGSNWLPAWFHLLRGSCYIVESSRPWLKSGQHVRYELDALSDYSDAPCYYQLSELLTELPPTTNEPVLCETVFLTLRESFVRGSILHHNTPARNAVNFWVGSMSDEYVSLVQNKQPWALVALAYFCILVQKVESAWFMEGHGTNLMLLIIERLAPDWKHHLRWPCEELRIELN